MIAVQIAQNRFIKQRKHGWRHCMCFVAVIQRQTAPIQIVSFDHALADIIIGFVTHLRHDRTQ